MSTILTIVNIVAVCIGIVLMLSVLFSLYEQSTSQVDVSLKADIDDAIDRLSQAVQRHVDVSAVVGLVKQLDADPDALEAIKTYPETVRAAAWLHYINCLGSDLQKAQEYLSDCHQRYIDLRSPEITVAQSRVNQLQAKLDDAIRAALASGHGKNWIEGFTIQL